MVNYPKASPELGPLGEDALKPLVEEGWPAKGRTER